MEGILIPPRYWDTQLDLFGYGSSSHHYQLLSELGANPTPQKKKKTAPPTKTQPALINSKSLFSTSAEGCFVLYISPTNTVKLAFTLHIKLEQSGFEKEPQAIPLEPPPLFPQRGPNDPEKAWRGGPANNNARQIPILVSSDIFTQLHALTS
ncbi:hypothetical protein CDAR_284971 [Caerostris darwini]|uniref:Uncharacterized protein n=1 Tax=Caerostris darwini TaxID=1538125 RepID=A0AAV4NDZ2_9ARAC|nr:hypothetical protein CDAR_284971 [Caerostris darwini]